MDIVRDSSTFRPLSNSLGLDYMPTVYKYIYIYIYVYICMYIYQGVSNYWNRGFESNSNHVNKRISVFLFVSAVLWMPCKELISYTKSLKVARNEEKQKKKKGGVWSLGHMGTQRRADT